MFDPANRLVRECIELANTYPDEMARVLETYDAADPGEQRAQFETMLKTAVGALARLSLQDPEIRAQVAERRNQG